MVHWTEPLNFTTFGGTIDTITHINVIPWSCMVLCGMQSKPHGYRWRPRLSTSFMFPLE